MKNVSLTSKPLDILLHQQERIPLSTEKSLTMNMLQGCVPILKLEILFGSEDIPNLLGTQGGNTDFV